MNLKSIRDSLSIVLVLVTHSRAGLISLEEHGHQQELHNHHEHHHEVSIASSYMHFHGPVEGPEFEVKVPYIEPHHHHHLGEHEEHNQLLHGPEHGYVHDYVAHPKYEFSYGVEDHQTGDFHSQKESRDGSSVTGEYTVSEPGGTFRIVSYHAGKDGFHAHVHTSGKNNHAGGTYGYQHQEHHHHASPSTQSIEAQPLDSYHHEEHKEHDQEQLLQEYPAHEQGVYN